jgi:hypothetical protein
MGQEINMKRGKLETNPDAARDGISKNGKKVIGAGIFMLLIGFLILTKTDPSGKNWASIVSPFLIVGGYIVIAAGIMLPERK